MKISNEVHLQIESLAPKHRLRMVLLFGSAVTGVEHAKSDIDIAVQYHGKPLSLGEYADLLHDLQQVFPRRKVDLSFINHADPLFLKKITDGCVLLYGELRHLYELRIYAFKRFQDHRRYFAMERSFVDRFLKEMRTPG